MREIMHAKIHNATVTEANLDYIGSITIDEDLLDAAGLWEGEKVLVTSNTSGSRLETYIIKGERGSGKICMNGACAHLINRGEEVIIMAFMNTEEPMEPRVILASPENKVQQFIK